MPACAAAAQQAAIGLGANLGDARATVEQALRDLAGLPATRLIKASSLYLSAPLDSSGPDYVNAVALVDTELGALDLLHALQALENLAGRERPFRNAPRTLDLDLLWLGEVKIDSPELTLPHPRMHERAFVLHPLAEICPERIAPGDLERVADQRLQRLAVQTADHCAQ
jgi:2-amino-4-hydroxy-6-hydroxymethyldihydropteridine diphosphokinase